MLDEKNMNELYNLPVSAGKEISAKPKKAKSVREIVNPIDLKPEETRDELRHLAGLPPEPKPAKKPRKKRVVKVKTPAEEIRVAGAEAIAASAGAKNSLEWTQTTRDVEPSVYEHVVRSLPPMMRQESTPQPQKTLWQKALEFIKGIFA